MLKELSENNVENAKEKLELLVTGKISNVKIIMDKEKKENPNRFKIKSGKVYLLWL
jgi:hypothetical protein